MRVAAAAERPFVLALLDFQMPEMDGLALARLIKSDPVIGAIHLIMLTSAGQLLSPEELKQFGIDSCAIKPVKQSRLFDWIRTAVQKVPSKPSIFEPLTRPLLNFLRGHPRLRKMHILLAEDNLVNQKVTLPSYESLVIRRTL